MTRQFSIRILLSLLLLMSQQMATMHVMSHWSTASAGGQAQAEAQPQPDGEGSALSRAIARDQSCDQCLAFAQLAGPLPSHAHGFIFADAALAPAASISPQAARARTLNAFEPRGPPQA
ncbi:hypothetical protein CR152_24480 [Massilia violaceinigra]|uniref:DUF2946 domain-containing protein n=1 Tax=Massilia violaceinigra TaxID=2045208 RepID=A0A2D2DQS1_9BURK|nr:hypothetical protein [Massilia violaceinigra]ATQ77321.1 hypothetical protein CR152_24480 [Massilia violaceinigra]